MRKKRYSHPDEYTVISDEGINKITTRSQRIFIQICMVISVGLMILGVLALVNP